MIRPIHASTNRDVDEIVEHTCILTIVHDPATRYLGVVEHRAGRTPVARVTQHPLEVPVVLADRRRIEVQDHMGDLLADDAAAAGPGGAVGAES